MPVVSSCVICKYGFTYTDCPVKCDGCLQYVHDKCSKLSTDELKCLKSTKRVLKFFCKSCENDSSLLIELRRFDEQSAINVSNKKNDIVQQGLAEYIASKVSWFRMIMSDLIVRTHLNWSKYCVKSRRLLR